VSEEGAAAKLKVFISYSRRDCGAFAEELLAGLELVGFEPFLDRHDIAAGEDWETRLAGLIQAADTIVYVVSPEAVRSERCAWEVEKATSLAKRLIPVVAIAVAEAEVPGSLKRLNYIFFNEPHSFARALGELSSALRTDLDWIREHTRLGELAARWQRRNRLEALLLRGDELEAAKAWMAKWTSGAPQLTDAHRAFIAASAEAEALRASKERLQIEEMAKAQAARAQALSEREFVLKKLSRRTTLGLAGAGALTLAAGGLAYWGEDAERRFRAERESAEEARKQSSEEAIRKEAMRTDVEGQLSAFAAAPGQLADDGPEGGDSPYTQHLLAELALSNLSLQAALARAHLNVLHSSRTSQRPFLSSDLNGDIYLQRHPTGRRRAAIIVSVDKLPSSTMPNVGRDAMAWHAFLSERCGFDIVELKNPDLASFRQAFAKAAFKPLPKDGSLRNPLLHRAGLARVEEPATPANTLLLLFFAGAGAYSKGENYLMADDSDLHDVSLAPKTMIPLIEIQAKMRKAAAASILILDTNFGNVDPETR
jgi:hypothetical protein